MGKVVNLSEYRAERDAREGEEEAINELSILLDNITIELLERIVYILENEED